MTNAPTRIPRRTFLETAAALATLPAVAPAWAGLGQEETPWKMRLSTSSLHYRSLGLEEACRRISRLGFTGIDIWAHFEWAGPTCEHLEEGLLKMGPERFAALLKDCQLQLFAASCYGPGIDKFVAPLAQLGGCVLIRGSRPAERLERRTSSLAELRKEMKSFLESLQKEIELAAQHNCTLAIENHSGRSLLNRLDSIRVFTELNRSPHLGIALAPYHVQLNGESVEQAIRACGDQLKFFYAWQHGEGTQQLPGIGPTDLQPWIAALADIKYGGFVNPFMHHEPAPDAMDEALAKSRKYLDKLAPGT